MIALAIWGMLVATMAWNGALERLHDDLGALTLFVCAAAAFAYGVDDELRSLVRRPSSATLAVRTACVIAVMPLHAALGVALAPAAVVLGAACVTRAFEARVRSAAAASPGAKPGAP